MSLVSIIIPYYNKKKYIEKTIQSVIKQTYKKIEIILIYDDDNLSDFPLIQKIKKNDVRIKIIKNKKRVGAGLSRNLGIKMSKGEYIAFIDADDLWVKDKLSKQINFMKKNNLEFTHTSYSILENDKIISYRKARSFYNYKDLLGSCDIGLSSVILKKKIFSKKIKFSSIKTKEDFILWLLILRANYKIIAYDKNLLKWRKTNNSLSSPITQKIKNGFLVYNKFMKFNLFKSFYFLLILSLNYIIKNR